MMMMMMMMNYFLESEHSLSHNLAVAVPGWGNSESTMYFTYKLTFIPIMKLHSSIALTFLLFKCLCKFVFVCYRCVLCKTRFSLVCEWRTSSSLADIAVLQVLARESAIHSWVSSQGSWTPQGKTREAGEKKVHFMLTLLYSYKQE